METSDERLLPEDIRRIRMKLGLTQEQAGDRIGGGRRAFSKYESGAVRPSAAIEKLLRISERHPELMEGEEDHVYQRLPVMANSPFEASADDVKALTATQFAELLRRLLHAEALVNDLPEGGMHVASNINASDGGEDARIEWSECADRTAYLPSRKCLFQMKSGPIAPAEAGKEVKRRGEVKPMIRGGIEAGASYIMLSTHPYVRQGIEAREQKIRQVLRESGLAINDDQVEFRGGDQIAAWVNSHPSVALWLLERVRLGSVATFTTYEGWSRRAEHKAVDFCKDSRLSELRERIRACATVPGRTLRVVGLSGMGKSRLVFEAFSGEAERSLVMYAVESECPPRAVQSIVKRLSDSQRRAVVVVDECAPETHRQLEGMVSRFGSRVSLVTIDDELPLNVTDNATAVVGDASVEVIQSIIERKLPGIPNEDKRRLTEFSKGFPAVATRIAGLWGTGVPIVHSIDDDLVDSYITGGSPSNRDLLLKSAQLVSVFGLMGVKHPIANQVAEVAKFDGVLTHSEFSRYINDLLKRKILRQRGRCVTLQPMPIAMNLAERQWQEWDLNTWDEVLTGSTNPDLKMLSARQLAWINSTDIAKEVAKHVCRLDGPFGDLKNMSIPGNPEVLSSLSEIDRDGVAALIEHVTNGIGDLRLVTGDIRRNLVVAAETIAFHPDSFDVGADLLLELAVHENESWANNATGTFCGLFTLYLGGTAADATARLRYLDRSIKVMDDARLKILVSALGAGLQLGDFTRLSGAEFQGSLAVLASWQPRTNEDIIDYTSQFVTRLGELGVRDDEVGALARAELGGNFRSLVNGGFIDLIEDVTNRFIEEFGCWPDGLRGANSTLRYGDSLPGDVCERVKDLIADLRSTDLRSRIDLLVTKGISLQHSEIGGMDPFADYDTDIKTVGELAKESNAHADVVKSCLPSLVCGNQHMAYEFGKSLGELSDDPVEWLEEIIETMKASDPQQVNDDLLVGYLMGLHAKHPSKVTVMKEVLAESELFASAFTTLCSRLGEISQQDVRLAVDALNGGHLKPHHLRPWVYGGILSATPADHVTLLFDALIDHSSQGVAECADLMGMYVWQSPEKISDISNQVMKLAERSETWNADCGQNVSSYHFQELMKMALNRGRNDGLARSTALRLSKSFVEIDGYRSRTLFEPILPLLLSEFPEIAWPIIGQAIIDDESTGVMLTLELGGGISFSDEPDSAILNLPDDVLFAWCYANPERAPAFAARNLPFLTTFDRNAFQREIHPFMLRLIDEFGHREDVRDEIAGNIWTFGWSGSATEYYGMFYESVAVLVDHELRDVRLWARQVSHQLREAFERAKNEDDERVARSEFY